MKVARYTLLCRRLEAVNEEIDSPDQKPQSPSAPTASFGKSFRAGPGLGIALTALNV